MSADVSLFDALEIDSTERRVSSRRALALAHNRVERNLGRFLRAAQSEEEFVERLALIQDDFASYVATASREVGHEHPEHIAAALKDHYRLAVDHVDFEKTPLQKEDEEGEEALDQGLTEDGQRVPHQEKKKEAKRTWAAKAWQTPRCPECGSDIDERGDCPTCGWNSQSATTRPGIDNPPIQLHQEQPRGYVVASEDEQSRPLADPREAKLAAIPNSEQDPEGYHNHLLNLDQEYNEDPGSPLHHDNRHCPLCGQAPPNPYGGVEHDLAPNGPAWQDEQQGRWSSDQGSAKVTCPECGGDGKTEGDTECPKCQGAGKVANFGPSVLDKLEGRVKEGATLDSLKQEYEDLMRQGRREEAQRVLAERDRLLQPQPSAENYTDVPGHMGGRVSAAKKCPQCGGTGEITSGSVCTKCDGKGTIEDERVAAEGGNTDLGGPEPKMDKSEWTRSNPGEPKVEDGPNHKTVRKDPVEVIGPMRNDHELKEIGDIEKKELPSSTDAFADNNMAQGPHTKTFGDGGQVDPVTRETLSYAYRLATQKLAMGMSAQDFRMLADAIRTAPEGADKGTLANHVAQYLSQTNPMFDAERFLAAAIGEPQSGRDEFKGYGRQPLPGEQGGVGLQKNFDPDAGSAGAYQASTWPSDIQVAKALSE